MLAMRARRFLRLGFAPGAFAASVLDRFDLPARGRLEDRFER
jgi:hypothetical protein